MSSTRSSRRSAIKVLVASVAIPGATEAVATSDAPPADGEDIRVAQFGARGDGKADDSAAFQRAIDAATAKGGRLRIPAGRYRITRTLKIHRGIRIKGDGVERSILLASPGAGQPAIHLSARTTDSIMGFALSGIRIAGTDPAAPCDGIRMSTDGNGAAIHQTTLSNLYITDVAVGIALAGVVYRSCFDNITVSGRVTRYGFYCDAGFEDVTYNSFRDLEVTNVASGGYAYWIHSNFSNFTNLTADGCCYFSSPGGTIRNLAIEQITAEKPPTDTAIQLNQVQIADGINLIGVRREKCRNGIHVIGQGLTLRGIRFVAPQPDRAVILDAGSEGDLTGVFIERLVTRIEDYTAAETLGRWTIQSARALTGRSGRP